MSSNHVYASGSVKKSPALQGKVYCLAGEQGLRVFAVRPDPGRKIRFALSLWFPNGSNFALGGLARQNKGGWTFLSDMDSGHPEDRCAISFKRSPAGDWMIQKDAAAPCARQAGAHAAWTRAVFPRSSLDGAVTNELDDMEAFMAISCQTRKGESSPSIR